PFSTDDRYSNYDILDNYPDPANYGEYPNPDLDVLYSGIYVMFERNSFYWGPRQYAALSTTVLTNFTATDYVQARMRNWLHAPPDGPLLSVSPTLNMEQAFS